ncbi:MAG: class I SAM-dependent methyltransferase [Nitrospina sp.]|jgi:2-polyprenyl-3-methyl-5-hydroxy-6-metoxy-1,4-benzoquinol methylase|nr:class I SAM-dependent methyltransferase [Nitrospina sp.]MBT7522167.1 class I SAM-dependent methyltransferase [Nitrospina sp.]MDB3917386.1 class I SAM-dependent methyltransferase [bacterium]
MTDLFNEKAKDWDANEMRKMLSSVIGSAILEHVSLHDQMRVMDFGAGTGLITSQVAPLVKKIVAVDISEAMLNKLVSKPELQGKVEIVCQDIIHQPIAEKFDLIMSAMAMHHVKDTSKLIQRFSEHLSHGALIALADLDNEDGSFHPKDTEGVFHFGFERNPLQIILEKHGFREIKFITAHTINKEGKKYPIFLVTATKN